MSLLRLQFWGASGCVTGSKFLVESASGSVLVDCGLFQGLKSRRELNRASWPKPPSSIDFVILTHGHLDHVGMLPRLVRDGFRGPIFGTAPTLEIARIVMEDSAEIMMEEAKKAAAESYSRHAHPEPLYTAQDVALACARFTQWPLDSWKQLGDVLRFRYRYNGHILGSCFVELEAGGKRFVFSGDIGRPGDPLLFPPDRPEQANVLVLESTYGNKLHPKGDMEAQLAGIINASVAERGCVIIPSFAVERLQTVTYLLWQMRRSNRIPPVPVYVDSPMGVDVLSLFSRFPDWHRIPPEEFRQLGSSLELITHYGDTWKAVDDPRPKVVVAGSGMLSGGRVLTYLSQLLDRPDTHIVLVGFQAEGTRGRNLLEGAHELKIFGKYVHVAARLTALETLSAHADQAEILWWLENLEGRPEHVFLVHGEPTARDALRVKLREARGWEAQLPGLFQEVTLPSP